LSAGPPAERLRCVMLNAARLDYDRRISFERLAAVAEVSRHEVSTAADVPARVLGHDVVVNKEMPLTAEIIRNFPASVKLICEAGPGTSSVSRW